MVSMKLSNLKNKLLKRAANIPQPRTWVIAGLVMATTLACATNTPVAQQYAVRATRTPLPTFTNTPIPPSATPVPTETDTVVPTDTPVPSDTPVPTNTPVPATDVPTETPVPPTNTPVPVPPTNTPAPVPPTNTPEPTPIPQPVSPVATPVPAETAVPASPPGEYKRDDVETKSNCAHIGVTGKVRNGGDDGAKGMPGVTIQVTGDEDGFRGPYYATTDEEGKYGLVIAEFGKVPERVEFKAEIYGPDVKTKDALEWSVSDDCHGEDANQVMDIEWHKT